MEHYSQQTSRRKPIYITVSVTHGNVCDLSTRADEDPKVNVCTPAPGSQSSLSPQQGTTLSQRGSQQVRLSIFRSMLGWEALGNLGSHQSPRWHLGPEQGSRVGGVGAMRKCGGTERTATGRKNVEMYNTPLLRAFFILP